MVMLTLQPSMQEDPLRGLLEPSHETQSVFHDHGHADESLYHHIPEVLWLEILCRLPVESIFRFKCVSKHWLYLISHPSFSRFYISRLNHDSPPWTLLCRFSADHSVRAHKEHVGVNYITSKNGCPLPFTQPSSKPPPPPTPTPTPTRLRNSRVLPSGNGLLLFYGYNKCPKCVLYYVSNPSTKQWIPLPPPSHHDVLLGTGFITQIKNGATHYKVVRIRTDCQRLPPLVHKFSNLLHLETFSSETGEWRDSEVKLPKLLRLPISFYQGQAIPYNGILHWVVNRWGIIIAYDPDNSPDGCCFIEMPKGSDRNINIWENNCMLDVCQGRLRYFEMADSYQRPGQLNSWRLWVLEDYDRGKWRLQHSAREREICSLDAHRDFHAQRSRTPRALAFHPFDLDIMYFRRDSLIVAYNLRTGWFEREFYQLPALSWEWKSWWDVVPIVLPPWPTPAPLPCWNTTSEGMENGIKRRIKKILGLFLLRLGIGK